LLLCVALPGCGFEPLYGERDDGTAVTDQMAQIYILPIANRTGQVLYNYLRDRLVPYGQPSDPSYVLVVGVGQSYTSAAVRPDSTASRLNLVMRAVYTLHDARTRKVLTRGYAESIGAYQIRVEPYPTLVARRDVETRVARDLSDELRNRIAVYFSDPTPAPPPAGPPISPTPPVIQAPDLSTGRLGSGGLETGPLGSGTVGQPQSDLPSYP
jgi:LPS-assembly lipoprotein